MLEKCGMSVDLRGLIPINLHADFSSRVRSRVQLATAIWLAAESVQGEPFGQLSLGIVSE